MEPIPFYSLIPQHKLINLEVLAALKAVFEKNWYILGEDLQKFESEFAQFHGITHCIGVGNGYDALRLALGSCGLRNGDAIIVPANTYIATWLAIGNAELTIVPVEPDPETCTINPKEILANITSKTKAILPVHLYGNPCDMTSIMDIATQYNLLVIEDNAQAHGATWGGKITGSFGNINATSFYPSKNLGALGDGGAITTSNETLALRVSQLRNYGFSEKNICPEPGVNSRLDELQAAVLRIKLRHLETWNQQRAVIASQYLKELKGIGDLQLPYADPQAKHVYHLFVVRSGSRDKLKIHLSAAGIETMKHYPIPPHLQEAYAYLGFRKGAFPVTESIASSCLSLPIWPGMTDSQISFICDRVKDFYL